MTRKLLKLAKILIIVAAAMTVFGYITMRLWNWLVPGIFGWRVISFSQAIGLLLLCKILFGGFHKHGPRGGGPGAFRRRREWKRRMDARFAEMSSEERERFRAAMKDKWCGPDGPHWMQNCSSWDPRSRRTEGKKEVVK